MLELNEPSILDYLKYKLGMIKELDLPDELNVPSELFEEDVLSADEGAAQIASREAVQETVIAPESQPEEAPEPVDDVERLPFPWVSLLALFLALLGQRALEPPHDGTPPVGGILLYLAAIAALVFAYLKEEWRLPSRPKREIQSDPLAIPLYKGMLAAVAGLLAIAAFLTFAGNQFSLLNVFPWLLSILLFWVVFWRFDLSLKGSLKRIGDFFQKTEWNLTISRWGLLVLLVVGVVLFYRFSQTLSVPAEPFSDHAEKILDVYDVSQGQYHIFFPRNTGREAIQMYWTLLIAKVFGTGLSFLSLKLGTALLGLLTLPYVYALGKEIANRRVGLIAFFLMGISYWHNVISRVGLRFPLYPLFVAPTLFYLLRGIRRQNRNDFILAGLFLGLGLHGYSPFRIVPVIVLAAFGIYLLHTHSQRERKQSLMYFVLLVLFSLLVFLPLGRYALEHPDNFSFRAFSRVGTLNGESLGIFADNVVDGLTMLNYDNGGIWVHSVSGRPALGVVSGALFLLGVALVILRYARERHWEDLFLLLAVPLLQLPSTLSIAFPNENPALNRAGGAAVVVFLFAALAFDGLLTSLRSRAKRFPISAWLVTGFLVLLALAQNYDLVFDKYAEDFRLGAWNSSEMGQVISEFRETYGQTDTVWIVPYTHWVDTRLPGVWAGIPNRDFGLYADQLATTLAYEGPKLFMFRENDEEALSELTDLYPEGQLSRYVSRVPHHDFLIYRVP